MNVFVYEGTARDTATKSLVGGNERVSLNTNYGVNPDSGLLVIAYPDKD